MTALDEVTDIMRYTAVPTDEVGFRHDPAGEWVRFEDVAPELARLRREVQELTYQRDTAHAEAMAFHHAWNAR